MGVSRHEVIIWFLAVTTGSGIYLLTTLLDPYASVGEDAGPWAYFHNSWVFRLAVNLLGYCIILVPGYIVLKYVRHSKYVDVATNSSCTLNLVRQCAYGNDSEKLSAAELKGKPERSVAQEAAVLGFCFVGLQGSYLTWGLLQEKIMTRNYTDIDGAMMQFSDSQFLVFVNRILAFVLSGAYVCLRRQPRHGAPLYKYSYCSFSNIMSSWCQYEALKFVSFPTQVLAKASKIIPVMLMGKCISKNKYEYYEYVTAVMISVGMTFFLLGSTDDHKESSTTLSGVIILCAYMAFDSFTSNWQGELFFQYHMSSVQMMCGVNLFSCLFTSASLFQQGGFGHSAHFMLRCPLFAFDCIVLSICSAAGQLFIFYTIEQFGAVVFVIIMTVRQGLAIILSCLIYGHELSVTGAVGVSVVFLAIFLRIYCNQRIKAARKKAVQQPATLKV